METHGIIKMNIVHVEMAAIKNTLSKHKTRRPIHMISFVLGRGVNPTY